MYQSKKHEDLGLWACTLSSHTPLPNFLICQVLQFTQSVSMNIMSLATPALNRVFWTFRCPSQNNGYSEWGIFKNKTEEKILEVHGVGGGGRRGEIKIISSRLCYRPLCQTWHQSCCAQQDTNHVVLPDMMLCPTWQQSCCNLTLPLTQSPEANPGVITAPASCLFSCLLLYPPPPTSSYPIQLTSY